MKYFNSTIKSLLLLAMIAFTLPSVAQENYKTLSEKEESKIYQGGKPHEVIQVSEVKWAKKPKNIIFLIGDGMGLAQVYSGIIANGGHLNLTNFTNIGIATTFSADNIITDSAASGTALSTGQKTNNGAIGVDVNQKPIENIRETLEKKGFATGLVSTSAITHATPASFMAHQSSRSSYEDIASDFLKSNIDVFIGGGYKHFSERKDGINLIPQLEAKGYKVLTEMTEIEKVTSGKLAGLTAAEHNPSMIDGRGEMLPIATKTAINILKNDKDGFFLMVEGSQIDWGGHKNDTRYTVTELLDFDQAIAEAMKFALKNKETLIVVTADHETGGMSITGGDFKTGMVKAAFTSGDHTAIMVPVYAFGPGSELFKGIYDNTDIPKKMLQALGK